MYNGKAQGGIVGFHLKKVQVAVAYFRRRNAHCAILRSDGLSLRRRGRDTRIDEVGSQRKDHDDEEHGRGKHPAALRTSLPANSAPVSVICAFRRGCEVHRAPLPKNQQRRRTQNNHKEKILVPDNWSHYRHFAFARSYPHGFAKLVKSRQGQLRGHDHENRACN